MQTAIGIQARSGSSRLHHKCLQEIAGKSLLRHCYETCVTVGSPVSVAVVVLCPADDAPIRDHCQSHSMAYLPIYGDTNDVLSRYLALQADGGYDRVVRITADCPFPYVPMIDWMIRNSVVVDFVSNCFAPRNLPDGWDIEVMSPKCLEWLDANSTTADREHVTAAIYREEDRFVKAGLGLAKIHHPLDLSSIKISVDTQEDLDFVKGIYRP